jgi:hypothetical protein
MNDTTRMVGGALGVAVVGSVLSSAYASSIAAALTAVPDPRAAAAAGDSIGAAVAIAQRLGSAGRPLLDAARGAFVDGMGTAARVAVGVAVLGALAAIAFLPSRAPGRAVEREAEPAVDEAAVVAR